MVGETAVSGYPLERQNRHRLLNHYEDFEVGGIFNHHWGRTITEAEAIGFATENLLHEPALFNRPYAQHLGYRDIPVSSFFVYASILGLSVEDLSEAGGTPSLDRMTCSSTLLFFRVIRCSRVQECCRADYRAAAAALALSSGRPLEPIRMGLRWFPFDAAISFHAATERHGRRGKDHGSGRKCIL